MRSFVGLDSLRALDGGAAVAIGTFDGVHLGHRALIARTIVEAQKLGVPSALVTWDRHPFATLRPDAVPPLLTSPERKTELLEECGIDLLVVLPFDEEFSHWSPEAFVERVLLEGLGARAVFVGDGWRFGHKAAGDVALLKKMGTRHGFMAQGLTLTHAAAGPVSSTRVRQAIAGGEIEVARMLLGRAFDVDGEVLRGHRRGTDLGFPTANMGLDAALAHPARGVYAGRARTEPGIWYAAAVDLGVNPQFGGDPATSEWRIESYLLDFSGDLYGQKLRVEFHARLRDEATFESIDALVAQIEEDVEATRALGLA